MTDHDIQAAIDRYDYFLTDLYHERLNPRGPCYTETVVSDVLAWDLSNNITPDRVIVNDGTIDQLTEKIYG